MSNASIRSTYGQQASGSVSLFSQVPEDRYLAVHLLAWNTGLMPVQQYDGTPVHGKLPMGDEQHAWGLSLMRIL